MKNSFCPVLLLEDPCVCKGVGSAVEERRFKRRVAVDLKVGLQPQWRHWA